MKKQKEQKGITLIVLVVTIILLLILAEITILSLTERGLFGKTKLAEQRTKEEQEDENEILQDYSDKIGEYVSGSRDFKNDSTLINDFTITTTAISGDMINIKVNIEDLKDVRGYIYIVNNEVRKVSEEKEVQIDELKNNTTYKIKVIAIDKNAKTKISNEISQKTLNNIYIFKDGVVNSLYPLTGYVLDNKKGNSKIVENTYFLSASYMDNYAIVHSTNSIDFTNIVEVKVNVKIRTDGGKINNTFTAGLQNELTQNTTYDDNLSLSKTTASTTNVNYEMILDTSNVTGNKYLKFSVYHGTEDYAYTAYAYITSIELIYK